GRRANVVIGDQVILAHNATIYGPATIGAPGGAPAFVGFNAIIDGATVQPGAMVSSLAKVAPGIVIPTGFKVLPGMYIQTQAQAEDLAALRRACWSVGDTAFAIDSGGLVWVVSGHNGENLIRAEGATPAAA